MASGRSAVVAHVLWEHEAVGSSPTAPTIQLLSWPIRVDMTRE